MFDKKQYQKEYRQINKEKLKEYFRQYDKEYRKRNLEHLRQYYLEWTKNNRDKINAYSRKSYWKNREKKLEEGRKWRIENPEYSKIYLRNRYRNDEEFRERMKKYSIFARKKNIQKHYIREHLYRAKRRNAEGKFTLEEWQEILKKNNFQCIMCGTKANLSIDHIIPLSKNGTNYVWNLQPLCRSCNSRKNNKLLI